MTAIAIKIRIDDPEYQIIRDNDANTAFSSLATTLPHANSGDRKKINTARIISLFGVLSII